MSPDSTIVLTLASCAVLGFRHGFDYDHLAAITDITSVGDRSSDSMRNSLMYALGHAAMVALMASVVIVLHLSLPQGMDSWMERLVGLTLIVLALYVLARLVTGDRDSLPPARGMVILHFFRWIFSGSRTHRHPSRTYTASAAFGIGIIHGVGAETPSQLTLFLLAANLGGAAKGFLGLSMFLGGLLVMNTLMAASACGLFRWSARRSTLRFVSGLTAAYSLVIGIVFLFGFSGSLPNIS
jgi:high-affinity nickel-transport protein